MSFLRVLNNNRMCLSREGGQGALLHGVLFDLFGFRTTDCIPCLASLRSISNHLNRKSQRNPKSDVLSYRWQAATLISRTLPAMKFATTMAMILKQSQFLPVSMWNRNSRSYFSFDFELIINPLIAVGLPFLFSEISLIFRAVSWETRNKLARAARNVFEYITVFSWFLKKIEFYETRNKLARAAREIF